MTVTEMSTTGKPRAVHHLVSYIIELADRKPDQEIRAVIGCPASLIYSRVCRQR